MAAFARVNSVHAEDDGVSSLNLPSYSQTAGRLLIVDVTFYITDRTVTVTDTAGNTFTPLTKRYGASGTEQIVQSFYADDCLGHASNVVNISGDGNFTVLDGFATDYTYTGTVSVEDEDYANSGGATTLATPNMVASGTGERLVHGVATSYSGSATVTEGGSGALVSAAGPQVITEEIASAAGNYVVDVDQDELEKLIVVGTLFKAVAGTTDAAADSDLVTTVTGVGRAVVSAAGSITSTATATGSGRATAAAAFDSDAAATAAGVGVSAVAAAFDSDAVATVTGYPATVILSEAAGAISISATATAYGAASASAGGYCEVECEVLGVSESEAITVRVQEGRRPKKREDDAEEISELLLAVMPQIWSHYV